MLGNNKLEMKCTITEELEKNEPAINKNYTENIYYYKQTATYWLLPYGLPPLNTFLARVTYDKPFKTLYDRKKYAHDKTL